jgi:hypothetical protein
MRSKASREDINRLTFALRALWLKHPHQRLGQLLLNLARNERGETDHHVLWNLDEHALLKRIEACDWTPSDPHPSHTIDECINGSWYGCDECTRILK